MRRHAALCGCTIKCEDGIGRAARFERADLLKIFALEKQLRAARLIQSLTSQHWRPLDVGPNPLMCRANAIKMERHASDDEENSAFDVQWKGLRLGRLGFSERSEEIEWDGKKGRGVMFAGNFAHGLEKT